MSPPSAALGVVLSVGLAVAASAQERVQTVAADQPLSAVLRADGASTLQEALRDVTGPVEFRLTPGRYVLDAKPYVDPSCGNCQDPAERVPATVGLVVRGTGIRLVGADPDSVVIHTNAGYGILFDGCADCGLSGVTVTGGVRDPDGRATDGGVVVRNSGVTIERCVIRDNVGDSATVADVVVGIAGVVGREAAEIRLHGCHIRRNSWDGVALYRGARAEIRDNVVDGVDKARGARVGGGRGVGIGLTWDAQATVDGNLVTRYWKGIGVFVDARASVRQNIVEDILTWGIAVWGAETGRPIAFVEQNAIYRTGACGAMIAVGTTAVDAPGAFGGNAIATTAQDERYDSGEPYCQQGPLARESVPPGFVVTGNVFHDNRAPTGAARVPQLARAGFLDATSSLRARLRARPALTQSAFLRTFPVP